MRPNSRTHSRAAGDVDLQRRTTLKQLSVLAALSVSPGIALASVKADDYDPDVYKALLTVSGWVTGFHELHWEPWKPWKPQVLLFPKDLSYLQLMKDITTLLILSDSTHKTALPRIAKRFQQANERPDDNFFKSEESTFAPLLRAWYLSQVELPPEALTNPEVQRICGNLRGHTDPKPLLNKQGKLIGQISYDEALTWQACSFTKPSATCGGHFGYWQDPPPEHKAKADSQTTAIQPSNNKQNA